MKNSIVTRMNGQEWSVAGGVMLALVLGNMNPAAAQGDAAKAAIATLRAAVPGRVVNFAAGAESKKVKIGRGECTDLVDAALASAMAQPGKDYVWGTLKRGAKLGKLPQPAMGDIIQFEKCVFKKPDGTRTMGMPRHTAIVESAKGTTVTVLHQNFPIGSPVARDTFDLGWLTEGTIKIYVPVPK